MFCVNCYCDTITWELLNECCDLPGKELCMSGLLVWPLVSARGTSTRGSGSESTHGY